MLLLLDYVLRHTGVALGSQGDIAEAMLLALIMFLALSAGSAARRTWIVQIPIAAPAIATATAGVIASLDDLTTTGNLIGF